MAIEIDNLPRRNGDVMFHSFVGLFTSGYPLKPLSLLDLVAIRGKVATRGASKSGG